MSDTIRRVPQSPAIGRLAVVTRGVELAFMAAGITVAVIVVMQSVAIVLSWIAASG